MTYASKSAPRLLVIERTNWGLIRVIAEGLGPSVQLSDEDILARYKGMDGDAWPLDEEDTEDLPLEDGLVSPEHFNAVLAYKERASRIARCDLIGLIKGWEEQPVERTESTLQFALYGFDYGYYEGEGNHFSAVFHDIIYGSYYELRSYAPVLNEHLLLPTIDAIADVHRVRTEFVERGYSLEADEECYPVAVYEVSVNPSTDLGQSFRHENRGQTGGSGSVGASFRAIQG